MRCVHLNRLGRQCSAEAFPEDVFCIRHLPGQKTGSLEPTNRLRALYRLVALFLLFIFIFNAYQTVLGWLGW